MLCVKSTQRKIAASKEADIVMSMACHGFSVDAFVGIHYRPKVWNILKPNGNTRTWHFDLLEIAWHQPQTSIVTLMQSS